MEPIYFATGKRTVMNTDWSIENKVEKMGRKWLVTFGICNGTAKRTAIYSTKREAIAAAKPDNHDD